MTGSCKQNLFSTSIRTLLIAGLFASANWAHAGSYVDLSDLNGDNGLVINGVDEFNSSGRSVSNAGDVNGDGYDDILIGAGGADPNGVTNAGESYIVYGGTSIGNPVNLSGLDGTNGFGIIGIDPGDLSGESVSSAGDINGDGYDDILIGAGSADPNGVDGAGESYIVYGGTSIGNPVNLSSLNGNNGFVINGIDEFDFSGRSVSSAGDVDGDGYDDILIGASSANPNGVGGAGESYIVYGGTSIGNPVNLSSLNGTNWFVINGIDAGDNSGGSVSSAGDINGDGYDDMLIGAASADPNGVDGAGESYIVYGGTSIGSPVNLSSLNGNNGFVINGIDEFDFSGISVSSAGDVNGDGYDDILIGIPTTSLNGAVNAGESYIVYGGTSIGNPVNLSGLDGTNGFGIIGIDPGDLSGESVSSAGDINGDGYDDILIGAGGADPNGVANAGESYIVYGGTSIGNPVNLSSLNGNNGFVINGIDAGDNSGRSVSSAGDVNGDGYDDILIGAYRADPNGVESAGETYLIYGSEDPAAPRLHDNFNRPVPNVAIFFWDGHDSDEYQVTIGSTLGGNDLLNSGILVTT